MAFYGYNMMQGATPFTSPPSLTTQLSNQIRNASFGPVGLSPVNRAPDPVARPNYAMTTGSADDYGRTPVMVGASPATTAPRTSPVVGGGSSGYGSSMSSSSSSSASSAARPAPGSSSPLPALNTLGVPDDPRINNLIGRIDGFANLDPDGINARVAALMAPQEAMAQRQINSGVTNALSAQGVLPTGGLAEKMRADISAPIFERLALARNDAMDRYTNQGIDASRGLLSSLVALQEAQRNQRLSEAELGIRREDLGLRRDEAQRQAARDALQNQSLQQQMEMARIQIQQAQNPYRPDQVNYLNASQPGGLQRGAGGAGGAAGGGQTIGGIPVTGPSSSSGIVNQNDARAAQAGASYAAGGSPTTTGSRVGFSPTDPFGGNQLGQILSSASGSGALVGSSFNPNLASQGVGAGGAYDSANWARSAADMAAAAARF